MCNPRHSPALEEVKKLIAQHQLSVMVEVVLERVTNVSTGAELEDVTEFLELPTALAGLLD